MQLLGASTALTAGHEGTLRLDRTSMRDLLPRADRADPGSVFIETTAGDRFVAHVLPLTGGARQFAGLGGDAVAALFVQPADFDPPSIPESLARAFDLTPGELRVALATIRHDGVADVAETLGIGEATVRTHLHRIFAKTDTRRQADIVKLVAGFTGPLLAR
jgi:DNA-binding CsgD family transcriptional regulator